MAVAKSFENLEKVGSPFIENGREYIYVICKNGNKRKVRWYSEKEREKMDAKVAPNTIVETKDSFKSFNAHDAFFFGEQNFITVYKATDAAVQAWREEVPPFSILENNWFGFYSPSYFTGAAPAGIEAFRLEWKEISSRPDDSTCKVMKDGELVRRYVEEKIYGHSVSEYQGAKDEWLLHPVVIKKNIMTETHYGETHIHVMVDANGNEYVWTTASKNLTEGETYTLKMKVKDHQVYQGTKQTVVYYCKVI